MPRRLPPMPSRAASFVPSGASCAWKSSSRRSCPGQARTNRRILSRSQGLPTLTTSRVTEGIDAASSTSRVNTRRVTSGFSLNERTMM